MSIVEKSGLMKYKDAAGNTTIMYPITNTDSVDGLEEWNKAILLKNTQVMLPASEYWKSVCYGNDKFVAVALFNGIAAYSTDGINWTQTTFPTNNGGWDSVCYGSVTFVAMTNGSIAAYSTDGINWTQTTLPYDSYWTSVCYGNGTFVAVDSPSSVSVYSYDGINWTNIGNDLKVFDPDGTNVTANLNKALGTVTMTEVNTAIQSAIQNTWEASY